MEKEKRSRAKKWVHLFTVMVVNIMISIGLAPAEARAKAVTMKISLSFVESDPISQTVKYWAERVEKETNGTVKFKLYYSASLVPIPKQWGAFQAGVTEGMDGATSFISGKVPDFSPIELPGAIPTTKWPEARKKMFPVLDEIFAENGAKLISINYIGPQIAIHRDKFLKSATDFKGQKIRCAGRWMARTAELLGAKAMFMGPGDLYTALQRGTVDGALLMLMMTKSMKFYEVTPYFTDLDYMCPNMDFLALNMPTWKRLAPEVQQTMLEAGKAAMPLSDQLGMKSEEKIRQEYESIGGIHSYRLTAEERKQLLEATAPVWDEVRKVCTPLGNKLVDVLEQYRMR